MNILLVTIEGGGNIPPILDTIHRLHKKKHNVFVLSEPWMKQLVEKHGATFIAFTQYSYCVPNGADTSIVLLVTQVEVHVANGVESV